MQKNVHSGAEKKRFTADAEKKSWMHFCLLLAGGWDAAEENKWEKLSKIVIVIFFIALPLSHPQHHYLFTCKGRRGKNWRANRPLSAPFLFRSSGKVIPTIELARLVLVRQRSPSSSHLFSMSLWVMQPTDSTTHHYHPYHHCHHHHHPYHRHWPYRYYFAPYHFKLHTALFCE